MHVSKPQDRIAFDRAPSNRSVDSAGHLRVLGSIVSMACVSDYAGQEVPNWQALGLDPRKTYRLYRDAKSLEAATPTLNGKQLLVSHRPQTADDHEHEIVCGSLYNTRWEAPYVYADLTIVEQSAIDLVESGEQRALSCGYAYRADMTPCVAPDGTKADGSMVDIEFNHCALVATPRVPDAIVGDSAPTIPKPKPTENRKMAKLALNTSRAALLASGAIHAYMQPKLAADAKLDINALVKGVGKRNWRTSKPKIVTGLRAATKDKLAADASLEDVVEMLDQLDAVVDDMPDEAMADPANVATDTDAEMMDRLKDVLKAKGMSDEDIAACMAAMKPEVAAPEKPATDAEKAAMATKDAEKNKDMVSKPAMDAAIAAAAASAEKAAVQRMTAIREAEKLVHPIIGDVMAQDSAEAVHRLALDHLGVDLTGVHPSAFPALIQMHQQHASVAAAPKPRVAMDAAASADYDKRFPNANRMRASR